MATLQKIRQKGPLVAVVIGFALLAFILGDLFTNATKLFGSSQMQVAVVKGESISIQDYQTKVNDLVEIYKMQTRKTSLDANTMKSIRQQIWDQMVRELVLAEDYEKLGIDVVSDELVEMIKGENVDADPTIRQMFTDKDKGTFDSKLAVEFFRNINNPDKIQFKPFALYLEHEMKRNKKYAKYTTLISKGLNITDFEAKEAYKERVNMVDFDFAVKRYSQVPDSTITPDVSRMKKYYQEHKKDFEQDYTRSISFITFAVVPSQEDKVAAKKVLEDLKADFAKATDNEAFVARNSDVANPIKNFRRDELKEIGPDSLVFSADSGTVFGPYFQGNAFKIAKITGTVTMLPDTVGASHILIQPDGTKIKDMAAAHLVADSLKVLLDGGADFAQMAKDNSADKGSAEKGGDLDKFTEGRMVKPFNDACFKGETGDIAIVESQFGVHIIKITYQSVYVQKIPIAVIENSLEPSKETRQLYYTEASKFAAENRTATKFNATVEEKGYTLKKANDLTPMGEAIAGLLNPRDIIKWAFNEESEEGTVSQVFTNDDNFVVALVTEVNKKGIPDFEAVKKDIAISVIKEIKGEQFAKALKGADVEKAAIIAGGKVSSAKNIAFSSSQFPGGGAELKVIGLASLLEKDKDSDPIIGQNGVYVIKVTSKTGVETDKIKATDYKTDFDNLTRRVAFRANREPYNALKKAANIEDNRARFY